MTLRSSSQRSPDRSACSRRGRKRADLIGLARIISDGQTIAYIQDILVSPNQQRQGVGGALLDELLVRTRGIRQVVLLTDAEDSQRAFYESRAFVEAHDFAPHQLRAFALVR